MILSSFSLILMANPPVILKFFSTFVLLFA